MTIIDSFTDKVTKADFYDAIGERIREKRQAAGMSLDGLATAVRVSKSTVIHAENGTSITVLLLARIATALDVMLDELVPIGSEG